MALPALAAAMGPALARIGGAAAITSLTGALAKLSISIGAFEVIFESVGEDFKEALSKVTEVDQRLAVINSDFSELLEKNTEGLKDTTGGLAQASRALTELRIRGFDKNNKNIVDLATRLKMSGQNTEAFFSLAERLISIGGLTEGAVDRLAGNIRDYSAAFGTSADSLISAVDKLSSNLADLTITGGVEAVSEGVAKLTAVAGPEASDIIGRAFQKLTSLDVDLGQISRLGLVDALDRFTRGVGDPAENAAEILNIASQNVTQILGEQGELNRISAQALRGTVGDLGVELRLAQEAYLKGLENASNGVSLEDRISELFGVFKERLLAPFNSIIAELQPSFEFMIKGIAVLGTSVLNFVSAFGPIIAAVSRIIGFVAGAIGFIANLVSTVVDLIVGSVGWLFGFGDGPKVKDYVKAMDTTLGISQSTLNQQREISQSQLRMVSISDQNNKLLESMNYYGVRDSHNLERIGTASESSERRALMERITNAAQITEFTRQNLTVVDRLSRSVELQGMLDLISVTEDVAEFTRATAGYARKSVPKPPAPGAAYSQMR